MAGELEKYSVKECNKDAILSAILPQIGEHRENLLPTTKVAKSTDE